MADYAVKAAAKVEVEMLHELQILPGEDFDKKLEEYGVHLEVLDDDEGILYMKFRDGTYALISIPDLQSQSEILLHEECLDESRMMNVGWLSYETARAYEEAIREDNERESAEYEYKRYLELKEKFETKS